MARSALPYKLKQKLLRYARQQKAIAEFGREVMGELEDICNSKGYELDILLANDSTSDGRRTEALAYIANGEGVPEENVSEIEEFLNSL